MSPRALLPAALLAVALAGGVRPLAAQSRECRDPKTQTAMNHCAQEGWRAADAELNAAYGRLSARLGTARRAKLRTAQLAWIRFRDGHCDFERSLHAGGSMQPAVYYACMASTTRARTAQLREALEAEG
ncbi:MAG TPA: lysozyme inhibitor LprI family protein [Longimicrobiaceae bacterium]|nr:lysozyme inhibitor LprI family protein [Longimicrobiaceae bacterium]